MSSKWCGDCEKIVPAEKKSYIPGLVLVLSILFYAFVPVLGTFIGLPATIMAFFWYLLTKTVCGECGRSNLKKPDDEPSEYKRIGEKYNTTKED